MSIERRNAGPLISTKASIGLGAVLGVGAMILLPVLLHTLFLAAVVIVVLLGVVTVVNLLK